MKQELDELVASVADAVRCAGASVASCESLTGGRIAVALSSAEQAADWYRGGIVAYQSGLKHGLLDTPDGPVVTADTATRMAYSAAQLLHADYTVAVTGVGGPDPQEGWPAGTVYIATSTYGESSGADLHQFDGGPIEVMKQTVRAALEAPLAQIVSSTSE